LYLDLPLGQENDWQFIFCSSGRPSTTQDEVHIASMISRKCKV
jgi:hypothetical protein